MRVFIGEFICGGGMRRRTRDSIEPSLAAEGAAMLSAIAHDAAKVAELSIPVDPRLAPSLPDGMLHEMELRSALWGQWVRAAQGCDAAILIAPESNGVLAKAVGMLRAGGIDVIASTGNFLRAAGDKHQTARIFSTSGVPHPVTYNPADSFSLERLRSFDRYIVKPFDGCGTQQITLFDELDAAVQAATPNMVMQGFVPGKAISIAAIIDSHETFVLPAVSQTVSIQSCTYHGGEGPLSEDKQRRAVALAQKALASMPSSPRGFIGFDMVLGDNPAHDVVIEVNARLTTSYVGLRHMVSSNLAARLLGLESGPIQCRVHANAVRWTASGDVWLNSEPIIVP